MFFSITFCILSTGVLVLATGFGLSASTNSTVPGGTFTVTISGARGLFSVSGSNATPSVSQTMCSMSGGCSFSVTAGGAGTAIVTVSPIDAATSDVVPEEINESRTVTVNVMAPQTPSRPSQGGTTKPSKPQTPVQNDDRNTDDTLASLSISTGNLEPAFAPNITDYKVSLPSDAKELTIEAKANDTKARVSGTGKKELKAGNNVFEIVCTAENETTRTYRIEVHVVEKPLVFIKYQGKKLGFVRNLDGLQIPTGFEETTFTVNGEKVIGWTNPTTKQNLVYLVDENNVKSFYLYHEKKGITSIYRTVQLAGKNLIVIDVPKKLQKQEGLVYGKFTIDEVEFHGWTFEEKALKNFCIIYLMDETGKEKLYCYETSEKTLQLYSGNVVDEATFSKLNEKLDDLNLLCNVLGAVALLAVITSGVLFVLYRKEKKKL